MESPEEPRSRLALLLSKLPPMSSHERSVLAATCLSSLGSFYTMTISGFALPQIQRGLSIPDSEVGSLVALLRFGALFSIVLAAMADRFGRRRVLIATVACCALCNLATAFAQSGMSFAWLQFLARFFLGGQILLAGVVITEELSARNRGFGMGLLFALGGMGGALTLLVYAFIDQIPYGWRSLFAIGGFGLLLVPWLLRSLNETRRFSDLQNGLSKENAHNSALQPFRDIVGEHGLRLAALVGVVTPIWIMGEPGSVFVSKHLQDELGFAPAQVGLLVAATGIAAPLGNILSGTLSDRFGRRPITILISLVLSTGMAIFYSDSGIIATALGLSLLMMSLGSLGVLHSSLSTELFPTRLRSTAAGISNSVGTIGSSLGLWLVSVLYGTTGSNPTSMIWLLVLTPISPLILLFIPETAQRELEEISSDEHPAS